MVSGKSEEQGSALHRGKGQSSFANLLIQVSRGRLSYGGGSGAKPPEVSGKDIRWRVEPKPAAEFGADAGGVGGGAVHAAFEQEGAVGAGDQAGELQLAVRQEAGVAADGGFARAVEEGEEGAFGGGDGAGLRVLDAGEQGLEFDVVLADGDANDALAGGGHHGFGVEAGRMAAARPG